MENLPNKLRMARVNRNVFISQQFDFVMHVAETNSDKAPTSQYADGTSCSCCNMNNTCNHAKHLKLIELKYKYWISRTFPNDVPKSLCNIAFAL